MKQGYNPAVQPTPVHQGGEMKVMVGVFVILKTSVFSILKLLSQCNYKHSEIANTVHIYIYDSKLWWLTKDSGKNIK